ncbi:MAG: tRNA (adenosine(37)-N6)-dimethylallyltransferase MiaA [Longimicrobiales bacterium]|nr:tRNA (adenosine(37)-N6)-dimethylallyltransferase MiaA [Longimicrobiales bacterium]
MKPVVLALTGPTTTGKTELSLALAHRLGAEVISMDSRQVYRGLDIGTDKLSPAAREGIPHHGLDRVPPEERYSAGAFARDARRWIEQIRDRGRLPMLVGGTGFFLRAVTDPMFREPPLDAERRGRLRRRLESMTAREMGRWVAALDPGRHAVAVQGGRQRLARTIEVALLTGRPLSWWHREAPPEAPGVPALIVVLELDRDALDRRIDARVARMVERGLVQEVRTLLDAGVQPEDPGMTATGYREVAWAILGRMSLEEGLERMRRQTRQYARRQMTWFRNQLPRGTLRLDAALPLAERVRQVTEAWQRAQAGQETRE